MLTLLSLYHQNLNFFSHIQPPSLAYTFCKWGPLILTLLATLLILRFRQTTTSLPLIIADYDYTDTEDDDHDDEASSISELEDDEEEEKQEERTNACFRMRGSTNDDAQFLRRPSFGDLFSLSEIANTKSVVKLWDSIGFGLGFDRSCPSSNESVVSVYRGEHGLCPNQAVLVSAGENAEGNLAVRVWDARLRRRIPAVMAEWGPSLGEAVGVESCEVHKVFVRDDGGYGVTVGDIRKAKSPLEKVRDLHWICDGQIHSL
ncbi:uncharacterized protein LOC114189542 [Vigna unguiculata]|uniref:Uncharacterized protein n=1 Tax=Vigna unguiculata TaxID=3917 RepID=A0A4D6N8Y8_VIGUN|nr:uncharacterized protein LOC114189542 [Vigna unguiculata]QCE08615.1 hypothetical protein DEO72_LG9g3644 [Vigna unguiculata]